MYAIGNELFRFVAVRPIPREAVDLGSEAKLPVPGSVTVPARGVEPEIAEAAALAGEGRIGEARERLKQVLANEEFGNSVKKLIDAWQTFDDRLHREVPETAKPIARLITELLHGGPAEIVAAAKFHDALVAVHGALFANIIAAPADTRSIATLTRVLRTLMMVKAVADAPKTVDSPVAIRAALRHPILISAIQSTEKPLPAGENGVDSSRPWTARDDSKRPTFAELYGSLRELNSLRADQLELVSTLTEDVSPTSVRWTEPVDYWASCVPM